MDSSVKKNFVVLTLFLFLFNLKKGEIGSLINIFSVTTNYKESFWLQRYFVHLFG